MNENDTTVVTPEVVTTETTEQTKVVESTADPLDAITDVDELRKAAKAQRSIAQRYKKAPPVITRTDESPRETLKPSDILRADEFKLYRQGYTESEIDLIMKNGGRDILKNEKNPLVLGLKVAREQRIAENAANRASDTSGTSALERKYTNADLNKMTAKELEAVIGVVGN